LEPTHYNEISYSNVKQVQNGNIAMLNKTNMTLSPDKILTLMENKSYQHVLINFGVFAVYSSFIVLFIHRLLKVNTFDKT
jgi:ABC-type multidrug transport system permease subunit